MKHLFIFSALSLMVATHAMSAQNNPRQYQNSTVTTYEAAPEIYPGFKAYTPGPEGDAPHNTTATNELAAIDAQINQTKNAAPAANGATTTTTSDASKGAAYVSDQDLTKAIYKAIREDRIFSNDSKIKIQVTVFNGKITLSGEVPTQAEKERAELLATQVNKLLPVVNNIKVVK